MADREFSVGDLATLTRDKHQEDERPGHTDQFGERMQEDLAKFLEAIASTPMENYLSDYGKSLIMRARLRNMGLTDDDIDKLNKLGIFKEKV